MDITPSTHFLNALRGERVNYITLAGEGVDNAFDAGANTIAIHFGEDEIIFEDDGSGITKESIDALFTLGEHVGMTTTQLGMFGMGIKSQAVNAGDVLEVVSVSKDGKVRVHANWREVLKKGKWQIDDPRWIPVAVGTRTYAEIRIAKLRRPPKLSWDRVAEEMAQIFHPALVEGRLIILNGRPIERIAEPETSDLIVKAFTFSDGRSAMLRAGILNKPSKLNRVHVAFKHRVIMPASPFGCGDYGGLTKMFARLSISGPWHLSKYKDELTDEDERSELEEATFAELKPILEKVNSASMDARIREMANLANDRLRADIGARPKREKQESSSGPKRPKEQGAVDPGKSDPPGPAKSKKPPANRLLITFDGKAEEDGIGAFQAGRPHRVNLSPDEPFITRLVAMRDKDIAADAIVVIALMLFERGCEEHKLIHEDFFDTFGKRISALMTMQEATSLKGATA